MDERYTHDRTSIGIHEATEGLPTRARRTAVVDMISLQAYSARRIKADVALRA